jgi:Mce-associated membrane protein
MPPTNRRTGIRKPRVAGRTQREATTATEVLDPPTGRRARGTGAGSTTTIEAPTTELDDAAALAEATEVEMDSATETVEPAVDAAGHDEVTETVERPADEGSTVVLDEPARPMGRRAVTAARADVPAPAAARPARLRALAAAPVTTRAMWIWGTLALVFVLLAAIFGALWFNQENNGPAANRALIDVGATSLVAQQVGEAVKTVYSYDFARLDENEKNARAVITPKFEQQFTQLFSDVRAKAPAQKAVVTATVALTGVRQITGDTAVVVLFMNQIATRTAETGPQQQLASAGRLTVTAKNIGGTWKIEDVQAV